MDLLPIISIIVSFASVCITGLIYTNSRRSLKQLQDKNIYELRLTALKKVAEVEAIWQTLINDVYHEKNRIRAIENEVSNQIKEMFGDVEAGLLNPSKENVSKIKKDFEDRFDEITEEEAKFAIRKMEVVIITLRHSQEESLRKYKLLYNRLIDNASSPFIEQEDR